MEILDQMLTDAKRLYEQTTGVPYSRENLRGRPMVLPKQVDPEGYLYQQIAHLRNLIASRSSPFWSSTPMWMPVLDAYEADDMLVLRIELPGLKSDDVGLSVGDTLVVVKGERSFKAEDANVNVLAKERFYGPFERWIPLPCRVKPDVKAQFIDGVLEIRLQKAVATSEGTRKVEIE